MTAIWTINDFCPERHMIRLDRKPQLFSMRVAALIFQNGHVLVQRGTKDSYWPCRADGRKSAKARRKPSSAKSARSLSEIVRSNAFMVRREFFAYGDYAAHELAFYYLVSLHQPFPFHESDIVHRVLDGVEVEFRWLRAILHSAGARSQASFYCRPH